MRARQLNLFPDPPRTYAVRVQGYGEMSCSALSRGKARAKAYRAFCEAFGPRTFHWFLVNSRVWRTAPAEGRSAA